MLSTFRDGERLRERWRDQGELSPSRRLLIDLLEKQFEHFCSVNSPMIHDLYPFTRKGQLWIDLYRPDMLEGYLDLSDAADRVLSGTPNGETGAGLCDLRGFSDPECAFTGVFLDGFDLSFLGELDQRGFPFCKFRSCVFDYADLRDISNLGHHHQGSRFNQTNLQGAHISRIGFDGCSFTGCRLTSRHGFSAILRDCLFQDCDFRKQFLGQCLIERTTFEQCNFRQACLDDAVYVDCRFVGCDFENVRDGFIPPGVE